MGRLRRRASCVFARVYAWCGGDGSVASSAYATVTTRSYRRKGWGGIPSSGQWSRDGACAIRPCHRSVPAATPVTILPAYAYNTATRTRYTRRPKFSSLFCCVNSVRRRRRRQYTRPKGKNRLWCTYFFPFLPFFPMAAGRRGPATTFHARRVVSGPPLTNRQTARLGHQIASASGYLCMLDLTYRRRGFSTCNQLPFSVLCTLPRSVHSGLLYTRNYSYTGTCFSQKSQQL